MTDTTQSINDKAAAKGKAPLHLIPGPALVALAFAFADGADKYQPYNWRRGRIVAAEYVGKAMRHLTQWLDGEDFDPISGESHLAHAMADLGIIIDAEFCGTLVDNRPPPVPTGQLIRDTEKTLPGPQCFSTADSIPEQA